MATVDTTKWDKKDQEALAAAGAAWNAATTQAEKDKAHADAEAIRAKYGYESNENEDGAQLQALGTKAAKKKSSSSSSSSSGSSGTKTTVSQDIPKQTTTPAATTDSRAEDAYDSMSAAEKKALADAGAAWTEANKAWEAAKAAGNQAQMDYYQALKDKAHADAEAIRLNYGFSGGDDGTGYYERPLEEELLPELPLEQPLEKPAQNYDLTEYLKQLYAAQVEAQLAGLKGAYEKSVAGYDAQLEQLPRVYDEARNKLAAQDAIARKSFDERAAANGLNSGTGSQVELARSSAFRRDLAGLDQAQAEAVSGLELEKTNLKAQYESALAQAEAEGNAALASALYEELVRVQGLQRDDAQQAAAQQAEALEQALKNGTGLISTGTKPQTNPGSTEKPTGKGYDNGSLSAEQVKALQAFYGVAQDGMWGPNSQKVSGLSANEAWQRYLNYGRTGGQGGSADGDYGSMSYDPDEGVFSWAGKGYYDLNTLVQDIARVEAQLTAAQKKQIQDELAVWGFEIRFE